MSQHDQLNFGSVQIHKKVLAELIASAVEGMEGIRLVDKSVGQKLGTLFGRSEFSGIDIKVNENGDINLEIKVLVSYGINIPDVARQTQEAIKAAMSKMVDVQLKDININVQGIEKKGEV